MHLGEKKGCYFLDQIRGRSLSRLLMGLEAYVRAPSVLVWGNIWEGEGRPYIMEKGLNRAGGFIRCSVRDLEGKKL